MPTSSYRRLRGQILVWLAAGFLFASQARADIVVWANDGGDKVTRDELRASLDPASVKNSVWDGGAIRLFAARNEVVSANLVIEAPEGARSVAVTVGDLSGPGGAALHSKQDTTAQDLFDWTDREVETFFVRYLRVTGLSRVSYQTYDEQHVPERLRKPKGRGGYSGGWTDRPAHDKEYPDIAVPMELVRRFDIQRGANQSVWIDMYVPKSSPAGEYKGEISVSVSGRIARTIQVRLDVRRFELPDVPSSRTMVATSFAEVARRYTGNAYPNAETSGDRLTRLIMGRQAMLAHRHRIALVDDNGGGAPWTRDAPRPEWLPRLDGSLFTRAHGYAGPGEGTGSGVFSVGTYGSWQTMWGAPARDSLGKHAAAWESWFRQNAPGVERFLYLVDETKDFEQLEEWARWLKDTARATPVVPSFATIDLLKAQQFTPSLDIVSSWSNIGPSGAMQDAADRLRQGDRKLFLYNGVRPASGSFATEDEGVALRQVPWAQYKKGISRWFYWNATYYSNYQGGLGDTDVFSQAQTFGGPTKPDPNTGLTGWNSSNGDGVLFYPGTDAVFPASSYGLAGPIASLRLKHWRRGIQDVEYLVLAARADKSATQRIVQRMVPKVLWEVGVSSLDDPTWVRAPISWSTRPDIWEAARLELANIIEPR